MVWTQSVLGWQCETQSLAFILCTDMDLILFVYGSWSARADTALQASKFSPYLFWFPSIVREGEIFVLSEEGISPLIFTRLTDYDKSDVPNVRAASGLFAKMRFPE